MAKAKIAVETLDMDELDGSTATETVEKEVPKAESQVSLTEVAQDRVYDEDLNKDYGNYAEMVEIFKPQKGKRAVPTLIEYVSSPTGARRFILLDIKEDIIEEAERRYVAEGGSPRDDEAFLNLVYKITGHEVPRMFRTVAYHRLFQGLK